MGFSSTSMQQVQPYSLFTDHDIYLFKEGRHFRLYEKFGSHNVVCNGEEGVYFAVWAPHAQEVSLMGDFNGWQAAQHQLFPRWDQSGIWEGFVAGLTWGERYKYAIRTPAGQILEKSDPYALSWEQNRQAASLVSTNWYEWEDAEWMASRAKKNSLQAPWSVYELHLGSWMRGTDEPERFFSYHEIAERLVPYVQEMGYTHVEFLPVMEHPYEPSWGYQITGFYAANSRFGAPQDLMFLIDKLHQAGIGVILDWVPSHFPGDANGLHFFDGTYLYEHEDPRKGFHPQWNSYIFNYGRNEVRSFLISNALFWLDRYHADGLRVDAVTSMLYLDYARNEGEWEPNIHGGNVNLEAKHFLEELNIAVYREHPDVMTIAEESSDYPMLTKPVHDGGIGFGMKWMMGWMHDTLKYFKEDPIGRKFHHNKITFASMYVFNENYMMPLSHDEVVHGKASMIYKMPGDEWQKFANLRALYTFMYTHPGGKLLFMGDEFGQTGEWNFARSLDWHLLDYPVHKGLQEYVKALNHLYTSDPSFYQNQFSPQCFEWVEANDADNAIFVYLRKGESETDVTMTVLNLTPRTFDYKIGVDEGTRWEVILNSDDEKFGGSGVAAEIINEEDAEWMSRPNAIILRLPPLAGIVLKMIKKTIADQKLTTVSASTVLNQKAEQRLDAKAIAKASETRFDNSTKTVKLNKAEINTPKKEEAPQIIVSAGDVLDQIKSTAESKTSGTEEPARQHAGTAGRGRKSNNKK